jgi:oxygen-independent coproporphyrinogen III oxidase
MEHYLDALEAELHWQLGEPQPVSTIFLGGGTPTHLPPNQLERLLKIVAAWLPLQKEVGENSNGERADASRGGEYSCEANPLDCDASRLQLLVDGGVNRLSLGGQSFSSRKLKLLERDHSPVELCASIERCTGYFKNLSLDLIFAAPGETIEEWQGDLAEASRFPLTHLSTYGLTIERGAAFFGRSLRRELVEVDSDVQLAMYEMAIDQQLSRGWLHYEVSNFALPGFPCRHNMAYWLGEPWWAFGPGAASFLWDAKQDSMVRSVNHPSTTTYMRRMLTGRSPVKEREQLSLEQRVRERLVFGLRMLHGLNIQELDALYGAPARSLFEPTLSEYVNRGWLQFIDERHLCLTRSGLVISDSLWPALLAD